MKKTYVSPQVEIHTLNNSFALLAGSVTVSGLEDFAGDGGSVIDGSADAPVLDLFGQMGIPSDILLH
jgi:hypothetical protein